MKELSFDKMFRLGLKAVLIGVVATFSSCSDFEPNWDVADYGYSLPNYCENSESNLQVLDAETREYGRLLAERGYLGEWDGILYSILVHCFVWGDYEGTIKTGNSYAEIRGDARIVEYEIARFLVEDHVVHKHQIESPFSEAFVLNAQDIRNREYLGLEAVGNVTAFQNWVGYQKGFDAMLALAARLQKGEIDDSLKAAILERLQPMLTRGEALDRFVEFTNASIPSTWHRWLQISLMLERYANGSGDTQFVSRLRAGRMHVAKQMEGTDFEQDWVSCILEERGVFESK